VCIKKISSLVFFCFVFSTMLCASDKYLERVKTEINRQLHVMQDKVISFTDCDKKTEKSSQRKTNTLLSLRGYLKQRIQEVNEVKEKKQITKRKQVLLPTWPFCAAIYEPRDIFSVDLRGKFSTKAFSSNGSSQDISHLVFGEEAMYVKDVVLASKLLEDGVLNSLVAYDDDAPATKDGQYHYLYLLRDQRLIFDASTNTQQVTLRYAHHVINKDVSFGLEIPFVRQRNNISLESSISSGLKEQLQGVTPKFYNSYDDLEDFLEDVLSKKNNAFNRADTEVGVGDILFFLNSEIQSNHCDRCVVGVSCLIPTAKRRDVYKLWDPELGNGGFAEMSLFGAISFFKKKFFSPHAFLRVIYRVPATVYRRVPEKKTQAELTAGAKAGESFTPFAGNLIYVTTAPTFEERDTTFRRFSDSHTKTKIHSGSEIDATLGNIFWIKTKKHMGLDLYYSLKAKGKDYLGFRQSGYSYDGSVLTDNSYEVAHNAGLSLTYRWDENWHMNSGVLYTFAGRNTQRMYELNISMHFAF
jgi:hypothetical protein